MAGRKQEIMSNTAEKQDRARQTILATMEVAANRKAACNALRNEAASGAWNGAGGILVRAAEWIEQAQPAPRAEFRAKLETWLAGELAPVPVPVPAPVPAPVPVVVPDPDIRASVTDGCLFLTITPSHFGVTETVRASEMTVAMAGTGEELNSAEIGKNRRLLTGRFVGVNGRKGDRIWRKDSEGNKTRKLKTPSDLVSELAALRADLRANYTNAERGGMYAIRASLKREVHDKLVDFRTKREQGIALLCEDLPLLKQADKERFGPAYRDSDYPTPEQMPLEFSFFWAWDTVEGANLRELDQEMAAEQERQTRERGERERTELVATMRGAFLGLAEALAARLEPDQATGELKGFRDVRIEKLREFARLFNAKEVPDPELAAEVAKVSGLLDGLTGDALKASVVVRERTQAAIQASVQAVAGFATGPRPKRRVQKLDD